jgi:hypothetical protein
MKNVWGLVYGVWCLNGMASLGGTEPSVRQRRQTPDPRRQTWPLFLLSLVCGAAHAETLVCDGVLGNSGAQGAALVRFGAEPARGIGVVHDRFGALWDRAGKGVLNRYAIDGRLLAQYRIPGGEDGHDQIAAVGDTLVLLIAHQLCTLAIDAPAGSEAKALKIEADCISHASYQGRVAMAKKGRIALLDPASGATTPVAEQKDVESVELDAEGAVYAVDNGRMRKYVAGREITEGWPKGSPGERSQCIDGWWYGHAWHGTIRRFDSQLDPAPGVVMGGASGSFIGHLDQNSEMSNSRGLARIDDGLFAASGIGGILQLLEWDGAKRQFSAVRRIGAVPQCGGLGLDRSGNVYHYSGVWAWDARPDTPLTLQVNGPDEVGQVVMLDDERAVFPGSLWNKPAFYHGRLSGELAAERIEKDCALRRGTAGAAVYRDQDRQVLLAIDAKGAAQAFAIDGEGHYRGDAGAVVLAPATPVAVWGTLARKGERLLAAGDGQVIEFARDGAGWKETRRWASWGPGPADHFGAAIVIAADGDVLAVADRERHRVLCFDLASGKPLAAFGAVDRPGDTLAALNAPGTIAVRAGRVVVHDAGNQRLLKLRLVR